MIPDTIAKSLQLLQSGQGSPQDIQIVNSWFAVNQSSLDSGTSATISDALTRARMMGSQPNLGGGPQQQLPQQPQLPFPSSQGYQAPGTPAGLPSSQGNIGSPDWASRPRMPGGIPATDLNLEAAGSSPIQGSTSPFPGINSGALAGLTSSLGREKQRMYNETDQSANPGIGSLLNSPEADLPSGWQTNSPTIQAFKDYKDQLAGTPMEGMGPAGIDMAMNDPRIFAELLAKAGGGGPNAAAFLGPRSEGAIKMAKLGLLGHSTRGLPNSGAYGQNLTSSPASNVDEMLAAQQFMDQFSQPGAQFADVNALYQEAFNRANNTNFEGLTDPKGNPLGIEGSIQMTNDALMSSAPFMSQEAQTWISSTLEAAAVQYKLEVGKGSMNMSYPAYLKSLGVDQMLNGVQ